MGSSFDPAHRNWWQRNWKWCVPVLCGSVLALLVAAVFALALGLMQILRSATPYQEPVAMAKADAQVIQALGAPVEASWFSNGKIETVDDSGHADLRIPLHGPKGKAQLHVVADKDQGRWRYQTLEVQVEGSDSFIALDKPAP